MIIDEGILLVYPEQILQGKLPYKDLKLSTRRATCWCLRCTWLRGGDRSRAHGRRSLPPAHLSGSLYVRPPLEPAHGFRHYVLASVDHVAHSADRFRLAGRNGLSDLVDLPFGRFSQSMAAFCQRAPGRIRSALSTRFGARLDSGRFPFLWKFSARERGIFLGGAALGLAPLLAIVCAAGFRPVLDNIFIYPVILGNAARRLPIFGAPTFVLGVLGVHLVAVALNLSAGFLALSQSPSRYVRVYCWHSLC